MFIDSLSRMVSYWFVEARVVSARHTPIPAWRQWVAWSVRRLIWGRGELWGVCGGPGPRARHRRGGWGMCVRATDCGGEPLVSCLSHQCGRTWRAPPHAVSVQHSHAAHDVRRGRARAWCGPPHHPRARHTSPPGACAPCLGSRIHAAGLGGWGRVGGRIVPPSSLY